MRISAFLLAILIAGSLQAQSPFPNVMLDNDRGGYPPCEPSIAISRTDKDVIVGAAILNKNYRSFDGGTSWTTQTVSSSYGVFGDPCIVADYKGDFYFLHLSDVAGKGWSDPKLLDRIVIQRSKDGGINWSNGAYMGEAHPKDQDKEWAAIDPRNNRIYVTWTQFDQYESHDRNDESNILFSGSKRGGKKWSEPAQINDIPGDCLDDDETTEGAVPAVGPNGEVYVAWSLNEKLYFDKSADRGKTWGSDIEIADQPGGWTLDIPGIMRCNGMPVTMCDLSEGPNRGTIYVNWADQRNGEDDTDIFVAKSIDGGNSWSNPIRVNDDGPGNQQFLTWMTIDQTTGYLYCIFYDRRNHNDLNTDVVLAYSRDGGESWTNVMVSDTSFLPSQNVFFGDYNNIDSHDGRIALIWTRMDEFRTSVWTSIIEDNELPATSLGFGKIDGSPSAEPVFPPGDPFEDTAYPLVPSEKGPAPISSFIPLTSNGVKVLKTIIPLSRQDRILSELEYAELILHDSLDVEPGPEHPYVKRIQDLHASDSYFYMGSASYTPELIDRLRKKLEQEPPNSDHLIWHGNQSLRIGMYKGSPYGASVWRLGPRVLISKEAFDYLGITNKKARYMLLGITGYQKQKELTWNEATNMARGENGGLLTIDKGFALLDHDFALELAQSIDPESAPSPHLQGELAYFKNMLESVSQGDLEILSPAWNELDTLPDLTSRMREGHQGNQFFSVLEAEAENWLADFRTKDIDAQRKILIKEMIHDLRQEELVLSGLDSSYFRYLRQRDFSPTSSPFESNWKESVLNKRRQVAEELEEMLGGTRSVTEFWHSYYLTYRFSPLADNLWFLLPEIRIDYGITLFLMKVNPYFRETIFFGATSENYSGVNGAFYALDSYAVEELMPELAAEILTLMEMDEPADLSILRKYDWKVFSEALENVRDEKWCMFNIEYL